MGIVDYISYVLGLLMDLLFRGLTLIGYPRLWACVVLFAIITRLLFLPERIKRARGKILGPVAKYELLQADPKFFEKTKDKELAVERAAHKKQVYKKYKLSTGNGCLTMLIQYPILVALFNVVKNPQEFIPSLEALFNTSSNVNSFLGVELSAVPINSMKAAGEIGLIIFVPLIIAGSTFIKMLPSLKRAQTLSDKIKVYPLCVLSVLLIGWCSAKLPLVISLYWLVNDCTYAIIDFIVSKSLSKTKFVATALEEHKIRVEKDKAEKEAQVEEAGSNSEMSEDAEKTSEVVTEISEKEEAEVVKE